MVGAQRPGLAHLQQEFEEGRRRLGHTEVGPRCVVKVVDLPLLPSLPQQIWKIAGGPFELFRRLASDEI